jgi:hypothetical protein
LEKLIYASSTTTKPLKWFNTVSISILSNAKLEAADVYLPLDTKAQVTVAQDGDINAFNFSDHHWPTSGTGRPQGNIVVIQKAASN